MSIKQVLKNWIDRLGLLRSRLPEDEFRRALEAGSRSGALDRTELELIGSILEFTDTTAKEVMVPRPDVVALNMDTPREALLRTVIEEGYSRLPVYKGTIDHIIGIVYSKDLLSLLEHRDLIILQDVIRPAHFVPESKKISELLRELQQKKVHLAIVVDEFGGTEGIITIEDIIEEIVGEIHDEYDEVKKAVEQASDGSAIVDANIGVRDFNEQFHADVPETPDYETVAGFLQKVTGRLPDLNEEIRQAGFSFTVLKKTARRLRQLKVTPLTPHPHEGSGEKGRE
jgi:CBS domain containing-hemolysin-like protein